MKRCFYIILLNLVCVNFAFAQYGNEGQNSALNSRIDSLENRISSLERRINSLEQKLYSQNSDYNNSNQNNNSPNQDSCSSSSMVNLYRDRNIFPILKGICPVQCSKISAKYLEDDRKNNKATTYECHK